MSRQKVGPGAAPTEWVRLLADAHPDLERVQLRWRRGRVPYRPLVPDDVDLDQLETNQDWIDVELDETHFDWNLEDAEGSQKRQQKIEAIVEGLWALAASWTERHGWSWCDFQLCGYDDQDELLFADGRRYKLDDDPETSSAPARPEAEHPSWRKLHTEHAKGLEEIIDYVRADRDDAVRRSKQTLDDNHGLWGHATAAMREGLDYQREQLELWKDHYSGRVALKAAALREAEKSHRLDRLVDFGTFALDATLGTLAPLIERGIEVMADYKAPVFPEFKSAQQAMAYLVNTLTETQLLLLTDGDREGASAILGVLLKASKVADERESLEVMMRLITMLRSKPFSDIAGPEQKMAARFIMNRLALYKLTEYGEEKAE